MNRYEIVTILLMFAIAFAIPHQINYQGKVTDTAGVGLNGSYDIVFRLFDAATSGTELWSEPHSGVSVTKGLFNVVLGGSNPINLPFDAQYYLQIEVEGEVISPRVPLTSVGYSFRAAIADSAIGGVASQDTFIAQWDSIRGIPAGFADGVDNVHTYTAGQGLTESPAFTFNIGNGEGISVETDAIAIDYTWFSGDATVSSSGVIDLTNSAVEWVELSTAVQDSIQTSRGQWTDAGSYIQANDNENARVYDDGGSYGFYYNGGNSTGGYFNSSTGYGVEVRGLLRGAYGVGDIGIYGEATSGGTAGIYALGTDANEAVYAEGGDRGLYAVADTAVYGSSGGTDGFGGYFVSSADTNGTGVCGFATSKYGTGVLGISPDDSIGWGVYGLGDSNDGAVFGVISGFSGSWYQGVAVTGLSPDIGGFFAGDTTAYSWGCLVQTEDENGIGLRARSLANTTGGYNYSIYASCSTGVSVNTSDSVIALGIPVFGTNYADSGIGIMGIGNNLGNITVLDGGAGVVGNGNSVGVFGYGDTTSGSSGVLGRSGASDGIGVQGSDDDLVLPGGITNGAGVVGYSDNAGVFGWGDTTTSSYGVYGTSDDDNTGYGVVGSAPYIGVYGQSDGTCLSFSGFGVYGYAADNAAQVDAGVYGGCENTISDWAGYFSGDVYIDGDYTATGTKSAAVKTDDGWHKVYCQESPEIWFEDFGSGKLENGKTYIHLPKDFLGIVTIDNEHPMKVFVQLTDPNCNGVAVIKHSDGFEVVELGDGKSNATFDWRVVAKRKGYENVRYQKIDRKKIRIQHQGIKDIRIDSTDANRNVSAKLKNIDNFENKSSDKVKFEIKAKNE